MISQRTDIVIVNWNSGSQLADCLYSLSQSQVFNQWAIRVVDNGSSDRSEACAENVQDVQLLKLRANKGFAAACNAAAAEGNGEFILFLNPDARLLPEMLRKLSAEIEAPENSSVAVFGVKLIGEDGQTQRGCARFPTPLHFIVKSLGLTKLSGVKNMHMSDWDHEETRLVDHVIGAFYMIRRSVFEAVGGFDERFFVYLEDLDLSRRVYDAGYSVKYIATLTAFHRGGGVSEQVKAQRLFYSLRSRVIYARKHFSTPAALLVAGFALGPEFIARGAEAVLRWDLSRICELLRAYRLFWSWARATQAGRFPSPLDRQPA